MACRKINAFRVLGIGTILLLALFVPLRTAHSSTENGMAALRARDFAKAIAEFESAFEQGDPDAANALGSLPLPIRR